MNYTISKSKLKRLYLVVLLAASTASYVENANTMNKNTRKEIDLVCQLRKNTVFHSPITINNEGTKIYFIDCFPNDQVNHINLLDFDGKHRKGPKLLKIKELNEKGTFLNITLSKHEKFIATTYQSRDEAGVLILNATTLEPIKTIATNIVPQNITFSPQEKFFAMQQGDESIDIFDTQTWEKMAITLTPGYDMFGKSTPLSPISTMTFYNDESKLFVGSGGHIFIVSTQDGEISQSHRSSAAYVGNNKYMDVAQIDFSPSGMHMAVLYHSKKKYKIEISYFWPSVNLYTQSLELKSELPIGKNKLNGLFFTSDSRKSNETIVSFDSQNAIEIFKQSPNNRFCYRKLIHFDELQAANQQPKVFSPNGQIMITNHGNSINIYKINTSIE